MSNVYGQKMPSELRAERNTLDRQIVGEIMKLHPTDAQVWHIIYLLSLEMENTDDMRAIAGFVKSRQPQNVFISPPQDEGDE